MIMGTNNIGARIGHIKANMARAAQNAGRDPDRITLLAVSKGQPVEALQAAMGAGQLHFGENYAQQLRDKVALADQAKWHFIGHLQRNKIKYVAPHAHLFHGLDSIRLATGISNWITARDLPPLTCLIQVKLDQDQDTKTGVEPDLVLPLLESCAPLEGIRVTGLMGIPSPEPDPEKARPHFRRLALLAEDLGRTTGIPLEELSMGMSGDYQVAIEEGATIVRVGSAIFGERP